MFRLVAASRVLREAVPDELVPVVLGVHYLGDVVAGVGVGLVILLGATVIFERGAVYGFAAAAVLSIPALVTTGGNADAALALGIVAMPLVVDHAPVAATRTVDQ